MSVTLLQLRTRSRQRSDMENNDFVSDAELTVYINSSIRELYDILVQKFQDDYYVSDYEFSTVANSDTYSLPSDFYKLLGVDTKVNGTDWVEVDKFMFGDCNRYQNRAVYTGGPYTRLQYRIVGSNIKFTPIPVGIYSMRLWYVPAFTDLADDTDTFDGINGWEEYVVVDAAIKMLAKEESDVTLLYKQKQDQIKRIESAAANRDANKSEYMRDVNGYDEYPVFYERWHI